MIKQHFSSLDQSVAGAAAAGLRRAGAARHALRDRHRQGDDRDVGVDQQPAAGAQPGIGRRLSRRSCWTSCLRDMLGARLDELTPARESAVPAAPRAERALFPAPRTRDEAQSAGARLERRRRRAGSTRSSPSCSASRGSASPPRSWLARSRRGWLGYERVVTESPDRESASRADEYTRNFLQDEALPTIWQELAFHRRFLPASRWPRSTRSPRDWFPDQNRLVIVSAPEAAGVVAARPGAARGRGQDRVGEAARAVRRRRRRDRR